MTWQDELRAHETMPAVVRRMAAAEPDRTFVRTHDGGSATWAQLEEAMTLWAGRFVALGVRPGDVVVTVADAGIDSLSCWLGLSGVGAVDAATNPEFRGRMLAYAVNNCRPELVVVADRYLPVLETVAADLETVRQTLVVGGEGEPVTTSLPGAVRARSLPVDVAAARERMTVPSAHDIACITYTSGTTGPSKAVRLPWGQLTSINLGTFPLADLDRSDVFYCTTSSAHFGSRSIPYHAAMAGAQVVIRSRFALSEFWSDVDRFGVTTGMLVGSMADMLLRSPDSPAGPTSLRNLFMAPLGPSHEQFSERFGVRICTVYNSTEGGVAITSGWDPDNGQTVGRLREGYPGFEVRLVDEKDFDVPDGTAGECVIRAAVPWVMNAGYLNDPEATATAWRNGWFHTGDALLRTPEGDYVFVDRLKDAIRRRGENISSFEVEADVLRHPDVVECAAVAVAAEAVEDEILLFAVLRDGSDLEPSDLAADLEGRMTRFMVPRYIELLDELPKTQATLRIIKADLRARGIGSRTWDRQTKDYCIPPDAVVDGASSKGTVT